MKSRSWTKYQLKVAVKNHFSYRQVLKYLKLQPAGGNYEQIKRYIKEYGYNIAHFKGRGWNKGIPGTGKHFTQPLEKILKKDSLFQSHKLKQRLFNAQLKPLFCEQCGWAKKTEAGYLPLELHHKNGDRHDNRIDNLQILCPNCHSLTPTHRGRTKK